jgi:hypothetical protein
VQNYMETFGRKKLENRGVKVVIKSYSNGTHLRSVTKSFVGRLCESREMHMGLIVWLSVKHNALWEVVI